MIQIGSFPETCSEHCAVSSTHRQPHARVLVGSKSPLRCNLPACLVHLHLSATSPTWPRFLTGCASPREQDGMTAALSFAHPCWHREPSPDARGGADKAAASRTGTFFQSSTCLASLPFLPRCTASPYPHNPRRQLPLSGRPVPPHHLSHRSTWSTL